MASTSDPTGARLPESKISGKPDRNQGRTLGRFELRRMLGQGAQSTVWLAFDPRLEREVAIKLMRADAAGNSPAVAQWLQEARSVSRLTHANIVPLFEADVQDAQPYLVFEYVQGQTLAQMIKARGALPVTEAVALALDVLEALVVAHASGVIHRDLKPSNVLVEATGRARVMDFGIAARVKGGVQEGEPANRSARPPAPAARLEGSPASQALFGTPGYMSPEAALGESPSAAMDIFSAGLVLAELLTGQALVQDRDPYRAIYRVTHEQLELNGDANAPLDDRLRAVVLRALALDARQRFASAQIFRDELQQYLLTARESASPANSDNGQNSTLDFLLRRMRHKSDFPAMSDSVVRIQGIINSDKESVGTLTNEILKDVALTNKLLRLVNTVSFARGGSISTVSRAVSLVGFNGIRNMAMSLVLLEHMQDKAHASVLKEEFLRSLMAGSVAAQLVVNSRNGEEAFIGATFQNLGRLLAEFYFPDEARTVRSLHRSNRQPVSEASASASVLGLSYQDLGLGIAKAWGLPDGIQRCMRKPTGAAPTRAVEDDAERQRWVATAANEVADAVLNCEPKELSARLTVLVKKYSRALGTFPDDMKTAVAKARLTLIDLASGMDLKIAPGSSAAKLLLPPGPDVDVADPAASSLENLQASPGQASTPSAAISSSAAQTADSLDATDNLASHELHATIAEPAGPDPLNANAVQVAEVLAAGIQDITNAMVDDFKLTDVLRMILETMYRAMDFQRIIFCMRDPKTDTLTGRFGLGAGVETLAKTFNVPLKAATPDLFGAVCAKGADTMISDANEPRIAQRLPAWYRKSFNAPTFLLLPLQMKSAPFGLIYADKAQSGGLVLNEKELSLLRTLRNQAVLAFKQAG